MIDRLPDLLRNALKESPPFDQFRLVRAYGKASQPYPLARPCVAVGVENFSLGEGALGGYWGKNGSKGVYGRWESASMLLRIYVPREMGGQACEEILERLCGILEGSALFHGCAVEAKQVASDRAADAFLMEARLCLTTIKEAAHGG